MAKSEDKFHSPEEIYDFILRNYTDYAGNVRDLSIGWIGPNGPDWKTAGGYYRVAVIDKFDVNHTVKIDPKLIDIDLQMLKDKARSAAPAAPEEKRERIRKTAASISARKKEKPRERGNDREHEH